MATITSNGPQGRGYSGRWGGAGVLCVCTEEEEAGRRPADRLCMLSNTAAGMAAIVGPLHTIGSCSGGGRESGWEGRGGKMSFFKRKSRLLPENLTRKSPIVHCPAETLALIKSGRPPTRSRPDFLSLSHRRSVCPSIRCPFYFSASLCPPLPPREER